MLAARSSIGSAYGHRVPSPTAQIRRSAYASFMTLAQLRMLLGVIEHGGFSKAALEMDLSQASVSGAIRDLERELGLRLLERGRFGAYPTAAGEMVAEEARWMLRSERAIQEFAHAERGEVSGELSLAVFHSVGSYLVPQVMRHLATRFPAVRVSLLDAEPRSEAMSPRTFGDHMLDPLRDGRADVAFTQFTLPDEKVGQDDMLCWQLFEEDYVAVVSKRLLSVMGVSHFEPGLLRRAPLLVNGGTSCGRHLLSHLQRQMGSLSSVQMVHDDVAMVRMAENGLGIGLLPRLAVGRPTDGLDLHPLEPRLTRRVAVTVRAADFKRPTVRAFLWALSAFFPEARLPDLQRPDDRIAQRAEAI